MKSLGVIIKRLREKRGLTQKQVEIQTYGKIDSSWLASFETGKIKFSEPDKLATLAAALGTSTFYLYTEAGIIEPPNPAGTDPQEQDIVDSFRRLSPAMKEVALNMLHQIAAAETVTTERQQPAPLSEKAA